MLRVALRRQYLLFRALESRNARHLHAPLGAEAAPATDNDEAGAKASFPFAREPQPFKALALFMFREARAPLSSFAQLSTKNPLDICASAPKKISFASLGHENRTQATASNPNHHPQSMLIDCSTRSNKGAVLIHLCISHVNAHRVAGRVSLFVRFSRKSQHLW